MHVCIEHSLSGPLIVCKIICIIKHICMSTNMLHLPCAETQSPTESMLVRRNNSSCADEVVIFTVNTSCVLGSIS